MRQGNKFKRNLKQGPLYINTLKKKKKVSENETFINQESIKINEASETKKLIK